MYIYICVLRSTIGLDAELSLKLFASVQVLHATGQKRIDLDSDRYAGRVDTKGDRATLGTFAGRVFCATLEIGRKKGEVRFIIPDRELERDQDPRTLEFVPL